MKSIKLNMAKRGSLSKCQQGRRRRERDQESGVESQRSGIGISPHISPQNPKAHTISVRQCLIKSPRDKFISLSPSWRPVKLRLTPPKRHQWRVLHKFVVNFLAGLKLISARWCQVIKLYFRLIVPAAAAEGSEFTALPDLLHTFLGWPCDR